jgi:hypothetical protein
MALLDPNLKNQIYCNFMSGSCHLDRASNVEIIVECQIFVIVMFFTCGRVLQFGTHSRYYKGALTQQRLFLVICTVKIGDKEQIGVKESFPVTNLPISAGTTLPVHMVLCSKSRYPWKFFTFSL